MSKVKLRSRCYKLSKAETANICNQNFVKHNLRSNDSKAYKGQFHSLIKDSNVDKSSDSGAIETSSTESQSTSQMSSGVSLESVDFCKWDECIYDFINCDNPLCLQPKTVVSDELEKHLIEYHVKTQLTCKRKYFQCLWHGCKVYKQKSLSYSWLERHVIDHTDNRTKPYSCIFDCHLRFASQMLLEKHVQVHINDFHRNEESANVINECRVNFRPKKSLSVNRKPSNHLNSYHVHRQDFIDFNTFTQIRTNSILQEVVLTSDLLDRFDLKYLQNKPPPNSLIKLMTIEFKIIGRRSCTNSHNQRLIEWIHPHDTRTYSEWIDEGLLQLAEYLSQTVETR